jgi:hypothetical protein
VEVVDNFLLDKVIKMQFLNGFLDNSIKKVHEKRIIFILMIGVQFNHDYGLKDMQQPLLLRIESVQIGHKTYLFFFDLIEFPLEIVPQNGHYLIAGIDGKSLAASNIRNQVVIALGENPIVIRFIVLIFLDDVAQKQRYKFIGVRFVCLCEVEDNELDNLGVADHDYLVLKD